MATTKKPVKKTVKKVAPTTRGAKVSAKPVKKTTVVKKPVKKATAVVKKPVKKVAAKPTRKAPVRRAKAAPEAIKPCRVKFTQAQFIEKAATASDLDKKQVKALFDYCQKYIIACVKKGGIGSVGLFGWKFKGVPVAAKKVPAIKKGTMVKNPFNGGKEEPHKGRAAFVKPATVRSKAIPMKVVKDNLMA